MFQSFNLLPVLSAFENVEYPLWIDGVPRAERRRRAEEALAAVGLADRLRHRPDQLSGGERQRVSLARALVHEPLAILADEPTANLDSRTAAEIVDLLAQHERGAGDHVPVRHPRSRDRRAGPADDPPARTGWWWRTSCARRRGRPAGARAGTSVKFAVIALRNLSRHRRRTLLSLLVIAAGAVAVILTAGFIRFSFDGLREALIHGGLGHLELMPAATARDGGPDRSAPPALRGLGARAGRRGVHPARPGRGSGGLPHRHGVEGRPLVGVRRAWPSSPNASGSMNLEVKLRGGANLADAPPPVGEDQVLLGVGLARSLGAAPGDVVTITAMTADGTLNALDVRVAGLVTTGLQELDARLLKTHLATAERLLGTDRVSSIVIGLDDTVRTQEVGRRSRAPPRQSVSAEPLVITRLARAGAVLRPGARALFGHLLVPGRDRVRARLPGHVEHAAHVGAGARA